MSFNKREYTARQTTITAANLNDIQDELIRLENDKYDAPANGIPKTDLASGVQTSLGKADTALQSAALNPYRTAAAQDAIDEAQDSADLLQLENIPDTVQAITFGADGNVQRIVHSRNGSAVRTDAFTFGANTITEVRTLASGESLTIAVNLATLQTTVTHAAAN